LTSSTKNIKISLGFSHHTRKSALIYKREEGLACQDITIPTPSTKLSQQMKDHLCTIDSPTAQQLQGKLTQFVCLALARFTNAYPIPQRGTEKTPAAWTPMSAISHNVVSFVRPGVEIPFLLPCLTYLFTALLPSIPFSLKFIEKEFAL
jgi:hypothetical protein